MLNYPKPLRRDRAKDGPEVKDRQDLPSKEQIWWCPLGGADARRLTLLERPLLIVRNLQFSEMHYAQGYVGEKFNKWLSGEKNSDFQDVYTPYMADFKLSIWCH